MSTEEPTSANKAKMILESADNKRTHRSSGRSSSRPIRRSAEDQSDEAKSSSSHHKQTKSGRSSRSPKPRDSGRTSRSRSHDSTTDLGSEELSIPLDSSSKKEKGSSHRKSVSSRRTSRSRSHDSTTDLGSEELSATKRSTTSFNPRGGDVQSDDQDAKRKARRSIQASAKPGVEYVSESSSTTTREARKNARASVSAVGDVPPGHNHRDSGDRDSKRRSRPSSRAVTPGVQAVTASMSSREARKSARASVSAVGDVPPGHNHRDSGDRDSKRRSRPPTRAVTPGVQAMTASMSSREASKSLRNTSTATSSSNNGNSAPGVEARTGVDARFAPKLAEAAQQCGTSNRTAPKDESYFAAEAATNNIVAERVHDDSTHRRQELQGLDDTLSAIRGQEEQNQNVVIMAEAIQKRKRKKRRQFCGFCFCLVTIAASAGGVASSLARADDVDSSASSAITEDEIPTGAPTRDYLFDPPSQEDCANLRLRRPVFGDRQDAIEKSFDFHFDVTLTTMEKDTAAVWNMELLTAIEEYLLPSLLGCDDAAGRRRSVMTMIRGENRRKLATLRYIIGDAVASTVPGVNNNLETKSCLPANQSELCFRSIVRLQLFLKGDASMDDVKQLLSGLIENENFAGVSVASTKTRLLLQQESQSADGDSIPLVTLWVLPPATFESVSFVLLEEVGSGSSPTLPATSPMPSESPSSNPSAPVVAPTNTTTPTRSPTASSTPRPTKTPTTFAPSLGIILTQEPTREPSLEPSLKLTTVAPTMLATPSPTTSPTLAPFTRTLPPKTPAPVPAPTLPPKTPAPVPAPTLPPVSTPAPVPAPTLPPKTPAPVPAPTLPPLSTPAPLPAPTLPPKTPAPVPAPPLPTKTPAPTLQPKTPAPVPPPPLPPKTPAPVQAPTLPPA